MFRDHDLPAASARFVLQGLHQQLADPVAAEAVTDDEPRDLTAGLVALDEVLHVQRADASELRIDLGDEHARRRVGRDPPDPLGGLGW